MGKNKQTIVIKKEINTNTKKCVYCGCNYAPFLTVDHIVPKSKNGTYNKDNLQICCFMCNILKDNLSEEAFQVLRRDLADLKEMGKVLLHAQLEIKFKNGFQNGNKK